jgi:hypothetical protein
MDGRVPHPFALPLIVRPNLSSQYRGKLDRYVGLMKRLYEGIHEVSGGRVIVDSMKQPYHVYAVSLASGLEVDVVHLVRDSRGVAFSYQKQIERQGAIPGAFRVRLHPGKAGLKWIWVNSAFHLLARADIPTMRMGYEALVSSPADRLHELGEFLKVPIRSEELAFIQGSNVDLPPDHLVAGNRMRLRAGQLTLRVDDEWRRKLADSHRRLVSAITWPLLAQYGSLGVGHANGGSATRSPAGSPGRGSD